MIDLTLFRIRTLTQGNLAAMLAFMGLFANTIILPFFLIREAGFPAETAGLILAVMPLVMAFVAPVSGYLSEKLSQPLLTGFGLLAASAGLYSQTLLTASSGQLRASLGQAVLGLGLGMFISPNNNAVLGSAPRDKVGVAGSLMAVMRKSGHGQRHRPGHGRVRGLPDPGGPAGGPARPRPSWPGSGPP